MFVTAADADVQACCKIVGMTRKEQKVFVHISSDLITVVNHTLYTMRENRELINAIKHYLSDTLNVTQLIGNQVVQANNMTRYHIHVHWTAFNLKRAVSTYESTISEWEQGLDKFNRKKASLELGRLTE